MPKGSIEKGAQSASACVKTAMGYFTHSSGLLPLAPNVSVYNTKVVTGVQAALARQRAALARRMAEGRGEGRARRRLLRRERTKEKMANLRAVQQARRRLVQASVPVPLPWIAAGECDAGVRKGFSVVLRE